MRHRYESPHESLAGLVRTFLIVEGSSAPVAENLPAFTNGMTALVCKTVKDGQGYEQLLQLTLFGTAIPPETLFVDEGATLIACFFKPFALATLFNLPAVTLAKEPIELDSWNAHKANALKLQICYACTAAEKVAVLQGLLSLQFQKQEKQCHIILYATDAMMYLPDNGIIPEILEKLQINERTFQRMFRKYVGIPASQYRQICRFQHSFSQLKSGEFDSLTDLAYEHGFADQSHFNRTFKEFTAITPHNYLKSGLKPPNP